MMRSNANNISVALSIPVRVIVTAMFVLFANRTLAIIVNGSAIPSFHKNASALLGRWPARSLAVGVRREDGGNDVDGGLAMFIS